ncbi:unnamed protein product [Heterobilharzia americana]|nr:unnamed protein product [Heterobilharzia americana]
MSTEIATPLLAFGCALIIFFILIVILVTDHIIRYHRLINQRKKNEQPPPVTAIYSPPDTEFCHVKEENLQTGQQATETNLDKKLTNRQNIGDLLQSRLNEAETDDFEIIDDVPVDYAYEGPDEEPLENGDLSSGTR